MPEPNLLATAAQLKAEHSRFAYSFLPGTLFVLLLWLIFVLAHFTGANLVWLGVFPHNFFGLIGIVTGPLIHSGLMHVLSNSFPLILLSGIILFMHRRAALRVFAFVYAGSGLMTWFIGRHAYHVGASGVVYGLAGFLLFQGLLRRDRASLAVSLAVIFLYAGLFHGLFPTEERISWEGHLSGFVSGLAAAFLYGDNIRKEIATGDDAADPAIANLQVQHLSSTLHPSQPRLPLAYTIAAPEAAQKYHYRYYLNARTGMVENPTNDTAPSSYKPVTTGRRYDRKRVSPTNHKTKQSKAPLILTVVVIAALVVAYFVIPAFQEWLKEGWEVLKSGNEREISEWVGQFGIWGPVFIIAAMVAQMFLFVVNVVALMLVAILAYGPLLGSLIAVTAVLVASTIGYIIGRMIGKNGVSRLIGSKAERKVADFVHDYGVWAIIIARISPVLSNDAVSFVAGVARMGYFRFIGATLAGIIPLTILLAWIGEDNDSLMSGLLWVGGLSLAVLIGYIAYDKYVKKKS